MERRCSTFILGDMALTPVGYAGMKVRSDWLDVMLPIYQDQRHWIVTAHCVNIPSGNLTMLSFLL